VERSDRPLGVFLEIVEERRVVTILDPFEDRQMQLQMRRTTLASGLPANSSTSRFEIM